MGRERAPERERLSWYALDPRGCDLATGRPPQGQGAPSPALALSAAPVMEWPVTVEVDGWRRLSLGEALGEGGDWVESLLEGLVGARSIATDAAVGEVARHTPAGTIDLPVDVVGLDDGVQASVDVDQVWLREVAHQREKARALVVDAGRFDELEAGLHVAMLVTYERLGPPDAPTAQRIAAGGQLFLLAGAVAWALTGIDGHPFTAWGELVAGGYWPIGPVGHRLVVCRP